MQRPYKMSWNIFSTAFYRPTTVIFLPSTVSIMRRTRSSFNCSRSESICAYYCLNCRVRKRTVGKHRPIPEQRSCNIFFNSKLIHKHEMNKIKVSQLRCSV
jgi:hypothetical protein